MPKTDKAHVTEGANLVEQNLLDQIYANIEAVMKDRGIKNSALNSELGYAEGSVASMLKKRPPITIYKLARILTLIGADCTLTLSLKADFTFKTKRPPEYIKRVVRSKVRKEKDEQDRKQAAVRRTLEEFNQKRQEKLCQTMSKLN